MLGVISIAVAVLGFFIATSSSWYDLAMARLGRTAASDDALSSHSISISTPATAPVMPLAQPPAVTVRRLTVLAEPSWNFTLTVGA